MYHMSGVLHHCAPVPQHPPHLYTCACIYTHVFTRTLIGTPTTITHTLAHSLSPSFPPSLFRSLASFLPPSPTHMQAHLQTYSPSECISHVCAYSQTSLIQTSNIQYASSHYGGVVRLYGVDTTVLIRSPVRSRHYAPTP